MKLNWKIFVAAFVFSFVIPILSYASTFLIRTLDHEMWDLVAFSTGAISFIVSPLLLFASFYWIGRNIDLVSEFPSVLVSLFVGSLAGRSVSYFSLYAGSYSAPSTLLQLLWFGLSLLRTAFSLEFFAGFTALAVAYIRKKRPTKPPSLGKE
jgi:hypothetical protein